MKSRLTQNNSIINSERNDIQQSRRGGSSWAEMKFKITGDRKQKNAPKGPTGADIFKKENYQKDKK